MAGITLSLLGQAAAPNLVGPDALNLVIGLGFMGVFPGLVWAMLERKLQDVAAARQRLMTYSTLSFLVFGLAMALLLGGLSLALGEGLKAIGFAVPAGNLAGILATGFIYGSLPGLAVGYLVAAVRSFL